MPADPDPRWYPCLWFDGQAEAAAAFYASVFPGSRELRRVTYGEGDRLPAGTPLLIEMELAGQRLSLLNADMAMPYTHAVSLVVPCRTQDEVDHYWTRLSAVPEAERCGWLKDRYGVSWQIVPEALMALMQDGDAAGNARMRTALYAMRRLDIAALERAYRGD